MEIKVYDIPDEGMSVVADTSSDAWFAGAIKDSLDDKFREGDKAGLSLTLYKFDDNVDMSGTVNISFHPTCDRCLKPYHEKKDVSIHMTLMATDEKKTHKKKKKGMFPFSKGETSPFSQGEDEDVDFGHYENGRINLRDILTERIILEEPIKHLCKADCKGLCQQCGRDLNDGPCGCVEDHHDHKWDALRKFKSKSEKF